ncbi:MAG TPA: hypothetical protein VHE35_17215 [Kofleriaceae bacterium]|nr:hypothetical protein [Kofleriaceae bacterium]
MTPTALARLAGLARLAALAAVAALAVPACDGTTADPGLDALMRVNNAQFYPGPLPAPATDLHVTGIDSINNQIWPGQINKSLAGRMDDAARAVALTLDGDVGYWIVPGGAVDLNVPGQLTWSARVTFSAALPLGPHLVEAAAVDADGNFGPPQPQNLIAVGRALDLTGSKLAVSLSWDTEADLDLHLVLPTTPPIIVWAGNPNSYVPPAPGQPVDPDAVAAGGILDFDSNSQCLIDGRREEDIVWRGDLAAPPAGAYAVLVDTFSLCAAASAHWKVDVFRDGDATPIAHAEGTVVDADTRDAHDASSGLRALTFTY